MDSLARQPRAASHFGGGGVAWGSENCITAEVGQKPLGGGGGGGHRD